MLTVAVLGPVEVRRDGQLLRGAGGPDDRGARPARARAGTPVTVDRLIEDLWADDAMATARNTLQSKVSQLRRALGDPGLVVAGGGRLRPRRRRRPPSTPAGVAGLAADRRRPLAPRRCGRGAGRGRRRRSRCSAAPLLPGAGDAEWATPHRARLDELRLGLLETRFAARVELGPGGELIGELEAPSPSTRSARACGRR